MAGQFSYHKQVVAACVLLFVALACASDVIEGEYIILLKKDLPTNQLQQHVKVLMANATLDAAEANQVFKTFSIGDDFNAIHARLTPRMVAFELSHPDVQSVEPNRIVKANADCNIQEDAIWNLARVDERKIDLVDSEYHYDTDASNVDVYAVDTGVLITHVEFEGRAVWGINTADSTEADCNGHGTHVAGTIAGKTYGLAKGATIIAVKVLACSGSGTTAGVIEGVAWVATNAAKTKRRSVANMSLGGGYSSGINNAVEASIKAGVTFVVAAGNDNANACNYSPASAASAITVAATTLAETTSGKQEDRRASFSNFGSCVDIFAPGQLIKAAWIGASNTVYNTISGTSMASPHVAGVAALILANNDYTPAEVAAAMLKNATEDVVDFGCVSSACLASPNTFLYTACA